MSESTKALNSQVSTLKKNPGRIGRLVKAAKLLIVPPEQYTTGKAKEAVAKRKAKRGLNGVVGESVSPFSDKALQKKAEDKKGAGYAAAGGAVGAGIGRAMAREYQKNTITIRGSDRTIRQIQAGKPSSKIRAQTPVFNRRAAKTLKGAGRLGALAGVATGAVAGLGVRKVKNQMEKKAVDKKTQDRALAASAVGSGAALGGAIAHDAKKSRIASRVATKGAYKHMGDASVAGAEKRLARASKVMTRMGKPLRRAGVKGALIGGLAGAALGAAHLKKEASEFIGRGKIPAGAKDVTPGAQPKAKAKAKVPPKATGTQVARVSRSQFLGKGPIPAAKDVSPRTLLKRKAGKVALGVAAGAALAGVAKKEGQSNIPGMALAGGGLAYARRGAKDAATMSRGLSKQMDHIKKKGGHITQMDVKMAVDTFKKPMARRALKAAGKGAAVGALAGAALDKMRGKK